MLSLRHFFLFCCLIPFLGADLSAQNIITDNYQASHARQYQTLNDQVSTLCFFIHTANDSWSEAEMDEFKDKLSASQEWLIGQAARYGRALHFNNDRFLRNYEPVHVARVYPGDHRRTVQAVMEELNFDSLGHFLEWYQFDLEKEKLKIVFFVKDNLRSHAYNYFDLDDVDVAIVYERNYGFTSDQFVISHEILHLFGAWDLYHGNSQSAEKAELARSLYPNSIMISSYLDPEIIEVDSLTAWRVGWHNDFKPDYLTFKPERKDRSRDHIKDVHWRFSLVRERDAEGNIIKKPPRGANSLARKALLIGVEKVYGLGLSFTKGHKPGYIAPFGLFLEYKLLDRLYLGAGINGHKAGYTTVRNMKKVEIRPDLLTWLPGSGTTYEGDILTRRNVTVTLLEYPLRATYVLQKNEGLELVISQAIGLNLYEGFRRVSYYWYQSEYERRVQEYPSYAHTYHRKRFLGFTSGFGIRKSLLRRWHLNVNLQLNYLGFRGEHEKVDPEEYRTASIGLNIGLKYNLRNELYDLAGANE